MSRHTRKRVVWGLAGVAWIIAGGLYWGWATSIAQPVNWATVLSATFKFAPLGLMMSGFAEHLPDYDA